MQRELLRARLDLLELLRSLRPGVAASLVIVVLTASVLPAVFAVATGVMVDRVPGAVDAGLDSSPGRGLLVALGVVAALLVLERVLGPVADVVRSMAGREVDAALRGQVLEALDRPAGIGHLENAATLDRINTMKGSMFGSAGAASVAALVIVGRYVQALAALAVVAWFSWWLAGLVGVVIVVIRRRWHRAFGELADALVSSGGDLREVTYTVDLAVLPPGAKELRVFGMLDWLVERAGRLWGRAIAAPFAVRARLRRSANLELAVLGAAYLVTFVTLARAAIRGEVALGVVAAVLQAEFSAAQLIAPSGDDFATAPGQAALRSAREVIDAADAAPRATGAAAAADAPREAIRFEDVSFRYPGSSAQVLDGLDLTIRAGESLALVGLNGAGKTTLVKLLCGLYEPTGGRITIDGTDLESLDLAQWRARIGVIFQDFVHYELPAADNISFGAPGYRDDGSALTRAAERAGIRDAIEALPEGWETVLSRQYDRGGELSGGQWQRVALARALYAVDAGAGLLVLDEPTANLDVRAEAELFDRFLELTDHVTSLLISHRLSTVRRADRIAVLDDGRVVESGTHDELLDRGGRYATLFRLQASQYEDTAEASPGGPGDA